MAGNVSWRRLVWEGAGYLYVALWDRKYAFKQWLTNRVLPSALIVLSIVEVVGATLHLTRIPHILPEELQLGLAGLLFLVAAFLVTHHWFQEKYIRRHEAVLVALRSACIDLPRENHGDAVQKRFEFFHDLLTRLVVSLEHEINVGTLNASILIQDGPGQPFRIFDQVPYGMFPTDTTILDGEASCAAFCASLPPHVILYVPSARFRHALQMEFMDKGSTTATNTDTRRDAFQDLGRQNLELVCSVACVQIPKETSVFNRLHEQMGIRTEARLILCLGARAADRAGALELNTLLVVANLLGAALKGNT